MHFQRREHLAKLPACKVVRQLHHQPLGRFDGRKESIHMRCFHSQRIYGLSPRDTLPFVLNDWLVVWQSPKSTIRLASATKFSGPSLSLNSRCISSFPPNCADWLFTPNSRSEESEIDNGPNSSSGYTVALLLLPPQQLAEAHLFGKPEISTTGRTSMVPIRTHGTRVAMPIASSRSLAWIRK